MKNLFYATKLDKNKNKLTVGYLTSKNREKYAKDANYQDTVIFADFNEDGRLALFDTEKHSNVHGHVLRGMLVNNGEVKSSERGAFVLYGKVGGKWSQTPFSFNDFSAANTAMKSMISSYEAMLIRDETEVEDYSREEVHEEVDVSQLTIGE